MFNQQRSRGRPSKNINMEDVKYFIQCGFTLNYIASKLGCCYKTLQRWCNKNNFHRPNNSDFSDEEIDNVVSDLLINHPNVGIMYCWSHIVANTQFRPSRERVRDSILRVDPEGSEERRRLNQRRIIRRVYNVDGPHHLWHMDGHHKLIRYGMITHGAIDGFSRFIIYLNISNTNSSLKPLQYFQNSVNELNIFPYRVKSDKGGENVRVADYVIHHRGPNGFLCSSSKFNTRIERLWREVRRVVIQFYMDLFKYMEINEKLDINNYMHIFILQYLFMPHIQENLDNFKRSFNHHKIRTENYKTPIQLIEMFQFVHPPPVVVDNMYGVDNEMHLDDDDDQEDTIQVQLFPVNCPFSEIQFDYFKRFIQPLSIVNDPEHTLYVKYLTALEFAGRVIESL